MESILFLQAYPDADPGELQEAITAIAKRLGLPHVPSPDAGGQVPLVNVTALQLADALDAAVPNWYRRGLFYVPGDD